MIVPFTQDTILHPPNTYIRLTLQHLHGPYKGLNYRFAVVKIYKAPSTKNLCYCPALNYPHKRGKGKCKS